MNSPLPKITLNGNGISRSLKSCVFQSPLAGVSDQVFRKLVRRWAPDVLLFTEMVRAKSLDLGFGQEKLEELSEEAGPIGVQLFDYCPKAMAEAAIKAEQSGAFLIDINMGCPVKKVARKGGGSGLLKEPELAAKIVKDVVAAVNIPVTVKTRLGWCENSLKPVEFSLRLEDAGAELITMHGRTRKQGFSGNADWFAIAEVKRALQIPLIANGDIKSASDAIQCLSITGADGIMIGRASMGAPWLAGQIDRALRGETPIPSPTAKERVNITLEQLLSLLEYKGDHGLLIARKHINWTCKGFKGASSLRHALMRTKKPKDAINLLEQALISLD